MTKASKKPHWGWLLLSAAAVVGWFVQRAWMENNARTKTPPVPVVAPPKLEEPKDPFVKPEMELYQKIMVAYSTGNFDLGVSLVQKALSGTELTQEFKTWLERQLPVLWTSQGWVLLKTRDCDQASQIFYRVLAAGEPIAEAQKGLGFCLRASRSWPEAASYLAAYVLVRPEDEEGRILYADTLESLGRFEEAVQILEGALHYMGAHPEKTQQLQDRLSAMRAKAKSGESQKTERSEHFFISFREQDHEGILQDVLSILEGAIVEYEQVLSVQPPIAPLEVILYRKEEFHDVLPGGPSWAEGVFDGRMRVPLSSSMIRDPSGRLAVLLRHELSHALVSHRSGGRAFPPWFDEGLAQYLSCRQKSCGEWKYPPTPGKFMDASFFSSPFVTLGDIDAGRAYLQSLYMMRYVVQKKGESSLEQLMLKLPGTGPLSSEVIAEGLGWKSFDSFHQEVRGAWGRRD